MLTRGSHLARAVHRSQAVTASLYAPPPAKAVYTAAAVAIMRQIVASVREEQGFVGAFGEAEVRQLEAVGDCAYVLCSWRDGVARTLNEGVQCVMPDAILAHLARCQPVSLLELHSALASAPPAPPDSCQFPAAVLQHQHALVEALADAAQGQRPWVNPQLQELLRPQVSTAQQASRRHMDPEEFRQRLAERFGSKKEVYENCRMLAATGELLCYTDRKRLEWYVKKGLAEQVNARLNYLRRANPSTAAADHQEVIPIHRFWRILSLYS